MPNITSAELYPVHSTLRPEMERAIKELQTPLIDKWNMDALCHPTRGANSKLTRGLIVSIIENYVRGAGVKAIMAGSPAGSGRYYVWMAAGRLERARINSILENTGEPGIPDPKQGRFLEFLDAVDLAKELRVSNLQYILFESVTHGREESTREFSPQVFRDEEGEIFVETVLVKEIIKTSKYPNPTPLLNLLRAIDSEHYAPREQIVVEDTREDRFQQQVDAWREIPVELRVRFERLIKEDKEEREKNVLELEANHE